MEALREVRKDIGDDFAPPPLRSSDARHGHELFWPLTCHRLVPGRLITRLAESHTPAGEIPRDQRIGAGEPAGSLLEDLQRKAFLQLHSGGVEDGANRA